MRDLLSKLDAILNESALRDKEDLTAKRQALSDLESDPVASKDPEISAAIDQRKADLEREAKSKGFEESFEIGDEFGISFSEDHEIATTVVDILEDGIVIELDDAAISMLTNEGLTFLDGELVEGVAGPKSCWKGYRKVGTKPGTGKNAGKRVNDCEKISEYFQFEFPKGKDRGPRDHGTDELERREKSFRKHELAKDGRDYKDAMSPKSKSPLKGKYDIAGPKGKLPEDSVEESGLQYHTGVKKHGKEYMVKAAEAGRKGASQKELGALKDKYSKAYKEDSVALPDIRGLGYDAQSLIFKLRRDVEEKRLQPNRQAVLAAARELAGDMDFAPELLVRQVLGQGMAEAEYQGSGSLDYDKILNAIAALYGNDIWDNDAMQDLANDLEQAGPTDRELDFIIANGKLPRRLLNTQFTNNDNVQFGEQGVAEGYPKHQDLSGISTDKLKAYLDKQSKQQNPGEGNQVKRVRAELQRRQQGVAEDNIDEAEYQGRKVQLGKKMKGDVKKSKVYVKNPKGNVVKVNFGDKKMKIKKSNPARRKSFRARHNCANPGPRHKARYWSCRSW